MLRMRGRTLRTAKRVGRSLPDRGLQVSSRNFPSVDRTPRPHQSLDAHLSDAEESTSHVVYNGSIWTKLGATRGVVVPRSSPILSAPVVAIATRETQGGCGRGRAAQREAGSHDQKIEGEKPW